MACMVLPTTKQRPVCEIIYVSAYKGYFRIICALCVRLIQSGKEGSETIVSVCDDCRKQTHFEAKRHQARQLRRNQQESAPSS